MSKENIQISYPYFIPSYMKNYQEYRKKGNYTDVFIECSDQNKSDFSIYSAHSHLLSTASPYLKILLESTLVKKIESPLMHSRGFVKIIQQNCIYPFNPYLKYNKSDNSISFSVSFNNYSKNIDYKYDNSNFIACTNDFNTDAEVTIKSYLSDKNDVILSITGFDPHLFKLILCVIYNEDFSIEKKHINSFLDFINKLEITEAIKYNFTNLNKFYNHGQFDDTFKHEIEHFRRLHFSHNLINDGYYQSIEYAKALEYEKLNLVSGIGKQEKNDTILSILGISDILSIQKKENSKYINGNNMEQFYTGISNFQFDKLFRENNKYKNDLNKDFDDGLMFYSILDHLVKPSGFNLNTMANSSSTTFLEPITNIISNNTHDSIITSQAKFNLPAVVYSSIPFLANSWNSISPSLLTEGIMRERMLTNTMIPYSLGDQLVTKENLNSLKLQNDNGNIDLPDKMSNSAKMHEQTENRNCSENINAEVNFDINWGKSSKQILGKSIICKTVKIKNKRKQVPSQLNNDCFIDKKNRTELAVDIKKKSNNLSYLNPKTNRSQLSYSNKSKFSNQILLTRSNGKLSHVGDKIHQLNKKSSKVDTFQPKMNKELRLSGKKNKNITKVKSSIKPNKNNFKTICSYKLLEQTDTRKEDLKFKTFMSNKAKNIINEDKVGCSSLCSKLSNNSDIELISCKNVSASNNYISSKIVPTSTCDTSNASLSKSNLVEARTSSSNSSSACILCQYTTSSIPDMYEHVKDVHYQDDIKNAHCFDKRCPIKLSITDFNEHVKHHVISYLYKCTLCSFSSHSVQGINAHFGSHKRYESLNNGIYRSKVRIYDDIASDDYIVRKLKPKTEKVKRIRHKKLSREIAMKNNFPLGNKKLNAKNVLSTSLINKLYSGISKIYKKNPQRLSHLASQIPDTQILVSKSGDIFRPEDNQISNHASMNDDKFICNLCQNNNLSSISEFAEHFVNSHKSDLPFDCPFPKCPVKFNNVPHMNIHIMSHIHISQYSCAHCSYSCATFSGIRIHVKKHNVAE